jgi:prepilin-type N-terminal cleavage/methylation domain-containing protein
MRKNKINAGFTMIEIAISSAILSVIFGGMTLFGIQLVKNNNRSQAIKNTVENVGYAIEFINKAARTSNTIKGENDKLFVIDNYAGASYCFYFEGNKLKRKVGGSGASNCASISTTPSVIAGSDKVKVNGTFSIKETDRNSNQRGFIRTSVIISHESESIDDFDEDRMIIQSSVSLRDYGFNSNI